MKRLIVLPLLLFICFSGIARSMTPERAREIMGENFFGVEEVGKYFGADLFKEDVTPFFYIPFSEKQLLEARESHVLVADFGWSILKLRQKLEDGQKHLFEEQDWYLHRIAQHWDNNHGEHPEEPEQVFVTAETAPRWRLIRKKLVPNSTGKTFDKQKLLLGENEELPTARTLAYMVIGHFLATGKELFNGDYVRTADTATEQIDKKREPSPKELEEPGEPGATAPQTSDKKEEKEEEKYIYVGESNIEGSRLALYKKIAGFHWVTRVGRVLAEWGEGKFWLGLETPSGETEPDNHLGIAAEVKPE